MSVLGRSSQLIAVGSIFIFSLALSFGQKFPILNIEMTKKKVRGPAKTNLIESLLNDLKLGSTNNSEVNGDESSGSGGEEHFIVGLPSDDKNTLAKRHLGDSNDHGRRGSNDGDDLTEASQDNGTLDAPKGLLQEVKERLEKGVELVQKGAVKERATPAATPQAKHISAQQTFEKPDQGARDIDSQKKSHSDKIEITVQENNPKPTEKKNSELNESVATREEMTVPLLTHGVEKKPGAAPQQGGGDKSHPFYTQVGDFESTLAVEGAKGRPLGRIDQSVRTSVRMGNPIMTTPDAALAQAENLRIAQQRIFELEHQSDKLRIENEELATAGEIVKNRLELLNTKLDSIDKEKRELKENFKNEMAVFKGKLHHKDSELTKALMKVEEMELRLRSDFKRVRMRERELENRLELVKAEKSALIRAKDENILDLKKKMDHLQSELENYKMKCAELNRNVSENQESLRRAVRALRLALSNLGMTEDDLLNLKKAE